MSNKDKRNAQTSNAKPAPVGPPTTTDQAPTDAAASSPDTAINGDGPGPTDDMTVTTPSDTASIVPVTEGTTDPAEGTDGQAATETPATIEAPPTDVDEVATSSVDENVPVTDASDESEAGGGAILKIGVFSTYAAPTDGSIVAPDLSFDVEVSADELRSVTYGSAVASVMKKAYDGLAAQGYQGDVAALSISYPLDGAIRTQVYENPEL